MNLDTLQRALDKAREKRAAADTWPQREKYNRQAWCFFFGWLRARNRENRRKR